MKKLCCILGTRPEIIKLSPVIRRCQQQNIPCVLIHTNQHYSTNMDRAFFVELGLPNPTYNLGISEHDHGKMVGRMLIAIEDVLLKETPDLLLVQGDTNTVLAGALAAAKLGIPVGHVEAGLRSYDRTMPEEINRVVTDHISSYLFCPTKKQEETLIGEGIEKKMITVTGNTIVDAVIQNIEVAKQQEQYKKYENDTFMLLTLHRPSNVDDPETLRRLCKIFEKISKIYAMPIYFPAHPRTIHALKNVHCTLDPHHVLTLDPVQYLEMLMLEKHAKLILTDSGGVQEEACILHTPCVTIRENTERPETVECGANDVAGTSEEGILEAVKKMIKAPRTWINPYGDGHAADRIIKQCE